MHARFIGGCQCLSLSSLAWAFDHGCTELERELLAVFARPMYLPCQKLQYICRFMLPSIPIRLGSSGSKIPKCKSYCIVCSDIVCADNVCASKIICFCI